MSAIPYTMPSPTAARQALIAGPNRELDSPAIGHDVDEPIAGLRHSGEIEDQFKSLKSRAHWRASLGVWAAEEGKSLTLN